MSEIGLAIGAILLILLLGRWRQTRLARSQQLSRDRHQRVSMEAMNEMISELAPTLRETAMVTAPYSYLDRGHIWASPCGKRVYIN